MLKTKIDNCEFLECARNGYLLAIASPSKLSIYNIWSSELIFEYGVKFYIIRDISWSNNDQSVLFSINSSVINVYSLLSMQKTHEYVEKTTELTLVSSFKPDNGPIIVYTVDKAHKLRVLTESIEMEETGKLKLKESHVKYLSVEKTISLADIFGSFSSCSFLSIKNNLILLGSECGRVSVYDLAVEKHLIKHRKVHSCAIRNLSVIINDQSDQSGMRLASLASDHSLAVSNFAAGSKRESYTKSLAPAHSFLNIALRRSLEIPAQQHQILINKAKREEDLTESGCFVSKNKLIELKESQLRQPELLKDMLHMEMLKRMNYEFKVKLNYLRSMLNDVTMLNDEKRRKRLIKTNKLDVLDERKRKHLQSMFEDRLASFYLKQNELECKLAGLLDTDSEIQASLNNLSN
jgi:hypothetical protein